MGSSSSRMIRVEAVKRGVPKDRDEFKSWQTNSFTHLPKPRGQEAFFKFLRKSADLEEEDIVHIPADAKGMNDLARSYQFWIKCEGMALASIVDTYVCQRKTKLDKSTELRELEEFGGEFDPQELKKEASKMDKCVEKLKDEYEKDLNFQFEEFKKKLKEDYGQDGEELPKGSSK